MNTKMIRRLGERMIVRALLAIPGSFCITLEVLLRRRFGERYLTWRTILTAFAAVVLSFALMDLFYKLGRFAWSHFAVRSSELQAFWFLAFWVASCWHKAAMHYRTWRGDQWYSQLPGESHAVFRVLRVPELFLFRFGEPALAVAAGLVLFYQDLDGLISIWLIFAGLCLFIKRQQQFYADRQVILDMIDSRARSEQLREAITRDPVTDAQEIFDATPIRGRDSAEREATADPDSAAG